jgi:hypothetical protein
MCASLKYPRWTLLVGLGLVLAFALERPAAHGLHGETSAGLAAAVTASSVGNRALSTGSNASAHSGAKQGGAAVDDISGEAAFGAQGIGHAGQAG